MAVRAALVREGALALGVGAFACAVARKPRAALVCASLAGALHAAARAYRESVRGRTVLITGGSRGLGLALAEEFAREGARVAILARDSAELERAQESVEEAVPGAEVRTYVCDVTNEAKLAETIRAVHFEHGSLDVLVNNAGSITVGPFGAMENEDFAAQMRLHFFAIVNACRLALPYLRDSRGRIVNISSMGGKVPIPHMLPYDSSKFALSGFSQGLHAELAADGVSVTTVYPTVMRTGSPIQAVFKGDAEKEFAWFASTDVMPLFSTSADSAARQIVAGTKERATQVVVSLPGRLRDAMGALFPELSASALALVARVLPAGSSHEHRTGSDSRRLFDRSPLFWPLRWLARRAEKRWNQAPKHDPLFNMGYGERAYPLQ